MVVRINTNGIKFHVHYFLHEILQKFEVSFSCQKVSTSYKPGARKINGLISNLKLCTQIVRKYSRPRLTQRQPSIPSYLPLCLQHCKIESHPSLSLQKHFHAPNVIPIPMHICWLANLEHFHSYLFLCTMFGFPQSGTAARFCVSLLAGLCLTSKKDPLHRSTNSYVQSLSSCSSPRLLRIILRMLLQHYCIYSL